ncbi:MAG: hypothetical protein KGI67_01825 [Pseudomonadota bacterium]|nr:hypothetical protein [Pseudomonadota bacterium]
MKDQDTFAQEGDHTILWLLLLAMALLLCALAVTIGSQLEARAQAPATSLQALAVVTPSQA